MEDKLTPLVNAIADIEKLYFEIKDTNFEELVLNEEENYYKNDHDIDNYELIGEEEGEESATEESESIIQIEENEFSDEDDLISIEEHKSAFLKILISLYTDLNTGDLFRFQKKIEEVQYLLENDALSTVLYKLTGRDGDEVLRSLLVISDSVSLGDFYENSIQELPKNITELTEELIFSISQYPELMHSLEPRLFEELIFKIFAKFRVEGTLTKKTRDGGVDIIGIEDRIFSKNNYIIECKRYSPKKKVAIDLVQRLYGIKQSNRVTKAFLVTSSSFTKPAKDWARQHCWELELKDYTDIVSWLNLFWPHK